LKGSTGLEGNPPYSAVVYGPNEGLTGTAYVQDKALIYYRETRQQHIPVHISKFRENITGKSKSIIFVQVKDIDGRNIGVIRCNNKEETPARHVGRFTAEDVLQLQKISQLISQAHSRISFVREKEKERERNINSLHHEILSPVDGILAHIEWIESHFSHAASPAEWNKERLLLKFSDMKQNSKLIDVIVTSMGRFDEDIRLNVRPISVPALLNTCTGFIKHEAVRKRVKINIEYLGLPAMKGDELQLMRVFYNLLRNAVKYSDPSESDPFIRIYTLPNEKDKHYSNVYFADNGIGIVPGEETLIFQKFVRGSLAAKYFPEGSGLGLAFCKSIMEKHGGKIEIAEGTFSKPTVFRLRFPREQST
jgi:signal transduction histidine kinase